MPFSTPLICCSSGVATEASTSVALAPMNVVVTWIIGGTISGYCAIGRPCIATTPSMTMMIDITIATIGPVDEEAGHGLLRLAGGAGWPAGAGIGLVRTVMPSLSACKPFGDDLLARLRAPLR